MKLKSLITAVGLATASAYTSAATVTVEITNITHGSYFTPIAVVAHPENTSLFEIGEPASDAIAAVAEGGTLSGDANGDGDVDDDGEFIGVVEIGASISANAEVAQVLGSDGLPATPNFLSPGSSVTVSEFETDDANILLSAVAMILPSNDAFIGLNSWEIPSEAGTYTIYLDAYDAGSEANNELLAGMPSGALGVPGAPGAPGGQGGSGGTGVTNEESNTSVHIHRGIIGDTNSEGGASDFNSLVHRWLNPVAKVVITVQ